jgi:FkbM family methyltransferase
MLGFFGARYVGAASNGNHFLQLNKDYALGCKGDVLELPFDEKIYKQIKNSGSWELEESKFLARGLKKAFESQHTKTALLDIGANTGLVTLQALRLSNTTNEVFLFEPLSKHTSAIRHNLRNFLNIHINEFALSDINGKAEIFTEATNHGNTSLFKSVIPDIGMISTQIQLVQTTEYCEKFLKNFDSYVIKCDTQGMDALILSRLPKRIWENCESAIIEVWSLDKINKKDVDSLLSKCQDFAQVSWHPNARGREVELSEVREFWLSKSGSARNLFLSKNF